MSGPARAGPGATVQVSVRSPTESRDFIVRGGCTVAQLKRTLAESMEVPVQRLVLIQAGRVLSESAALSQLRGSVNICLTQMCSARPQDVSTAPTANPGPEMVESELTLVLSPDPDNIAPTSTSPTSPFFLVEGLGSFGLTNNGPGLFPSLQRQMERQLLADPEMMQRVLGSPLVQSTLSNSSPQLARQLILSNPQMQQLLHTNPEVGDMLNSTDVMAQVLELARNPEMLEEVMHQEDRALGRLQREGNRPETITRESDGLQRTDTEGLRPSQDGQPAERRSTRPPPSFGGCTELFGDLTSSPRADPDSQSSLTAGMQALLEEIMASPGLMQNLLSGPCVSSLLNCLSQNPDLAAQMLLSHPLFSAHPQLQQQMRQQIPLFLQQMQNPELLSAMLNPKALDALLQIQQALQILAAEAPALIPTAGLGNFGANVNAAQESDSVLHNQSENGPGVATVTEQQQQQFVQQMLQALANSNYRSDHLNQDQNNKKEYNHLLCTSDRLYRL